MATGFRSQPLDVLSVQSVCSSHEDEIDRWFDDGGRRMQGKKNKCRRYYFGIGGGEGIAVCACYVFPNCNAATRSVGRPLGVQNTVVTPDLGQHYSLRITGWDVTRIPTCLEKQLLPSFARSPIALFFVTPRAPWHYPHASRFCYVRRRPAEGKGTIEKQPHRDFCCAAGRVLYRRGIPIVLRIEEPRRGENYRPPYTSAGPKPSDLRSTDACGNAS